MILNHLKTISSTKPFLKIKTYNSIIANNYQINARNLSLLYSNNTLKYNFSELKKMKQAFYDFLNYDVGTVVRNTPQRKDRKYKHIQIAKQFKQIQEKRKQERLIHIQKRKQLIDQKLNTQSKLITQSEKQQYSKQLKTLQSLLTEHQKELIQIQQKLEQTQANYILVQSWRKLVVLNSIQHLRHMNRHPSGLVLNDAQIKTIQNIHYLVTNNLPVQRYKIYELVPHLFQTQINQLQQSQRKLIKQKYLKLDRNQNSQIQYFLRQQQNKANDDDQAQQYTYQIIKQRDQMAQNVIMHINNMLNQHNQFLGRVQRKQTIWRNDKHLCTSLLSKKLNLENLTQQQLAFKKTLFEIMKIKDEWLAFTQKCNSLLNKIYVMPPEAPQYIKNHPVLMKHWQDTVCKTIANPIPIEQILDFPAPPQDKLQPALRKLVQEYFDPKFEQIFKNSKTQQDRKKYHQDLPQNKRLQIQFYKKATQIYQQLKELQSQQQYFKKLPNKKKQKIRIAQNKQQKHIRIKHDQLTKMIYLNNQNKSKFSLQFFSKYFNIQQNMLRNALQHFSYLKMDISPQKLKQHEHGNSNSTSPINQKDIKFQIIKFIF